MIVYKFNIRNAAFVLENNWLLAKYPIPSYCSKGPASELVIIITECSPW
jgi:hypothetical protein